MKDNNWESKFEAVGLILKDHFGKRSKKLYFFPEFPAFGPTVCVFTSSVRTMSSAFCAWVIRA